MKKMLGGLLIVSMMTVPQPPDLNYMAYLALRSHNRFIYAQLTDENAQAAPEDIDRAMSGMNDNSLLLTHLLQKRAAVMGRLDARMDLLSHIKMPLSEGQISRYSAFMESFRGGSEEFALLLEEAGGGKRLNTVQKEIMSEGSDYGLILSQLGGIITAQNEAIDRLTRTIGEGEALIYSLTL